MRALVSVLDIQPFVFRYMRLAQKQTRAKLCLSGGLGSEITQLAWRHIRRLVQKTASRASVLDLTSRLTAGPMLLTVFPVGLCNRKGDLASSSWLSRSGVGSFRPPHSAVLTPTNPVVPRLRVLLHVFQTAVVSTQGSLMLDQLTTCALVKLPAARP